MLWVSINVSSFFGLDKPSHEMIWEKGLFTLGEEK
ncbi:hypothetical protein SAMN06265379_104279 [Saccharicrinis carchari]|uniref:Uncharacterized protein n=1 Tax=Saccharicrinis carchari TaxID=1168039 RepID=A0A521D5U6_SACCC|nr:hypothetical protein SAMN06265379_104279 [Saccharicrinis carchari]